MRSVLALIFISAIFAASVEDPCLQNANDPNLVNAVWEADIQLFDRNTLSGVEGVINTLIRVAEESSNIEFYALLAAFTNGDFYIIVSKIASPHYQVAKQLSRMTYARTETNT